MADGYLTLWLPSHTIELLARNAKGAWEKMQLYRKIHSAFINDLQMTTDMVL
jgi:hypothetical protein